MPNNSDMIGQTGDGNGSQPQRTPAFEKMCESFHFIKPDKPLSALASNYLEALLSRNRKRAASLIMDAVESGVAVRDIYTHVFQPTQYEVGWLWQSGMISVGHEHYCTNTTQFVMSQLYPKLFTGAQTGKRMLAACVQGELHEPGLRMVTDFFEMAGWDTYYLGANMPPEGVVSTLEEWNPHVVAVGVTMPHHLEQAESLMRAVQASKIADRIVTLVGGRACQAEPDTWQKLGADGTAKNAEQAIALADKLTANIH